MEDKYEAYETPSDQVDDTDELGTWGLPGISRGFPGDFGTSRRLPGDLLGTFGL